MCLHRSPADFDDERRSGNARLLAASRSARALAALDEEAYRGGALNREHKEFMGLAISFATGCGDCVAYHLQQLVQVGAADRQIHEALDVVLVGCGSAGFPLARQALRFLEELRGEVADASAEAN